MLHLHAGKNIKYQQTSSVSQSGGGHRVGYQPRAGWWCRFLVPVFCKTHLVPGTKFRVVSCFFGPGAIFSLVPGTICMQKLGCNWHFSYLWAELDALYQEVNRETGKTMLKHLYLKLIRVKTKLCSSFYSMNLHFISTKWKHQSESELVRVIQWPGALKMRQSAVILLEG